MVGSEQHGEQLMELLQPVLNPEAAADPAAAYSHGVWLKVLIPE